MTKKEKLILGATPGVAGLAGAGLGYYDLKTALRLAQMSKREFKKLIKEAPASKKGKLWKLRRFGESILRGRISKAKYITRRGARYSIPALAATALALLLLKGRERR